MQGVSRTTASMVIRVAPPSHSGDEKLSLLQSRYFMYIAVLICGGLLCFHIGSVAEDKAKYAQAVEFRKQATGESSQNPGLVVEETCPCNSQGGDDKLQGDLLDRDTLVRMAQAAKEKVIENIRLDYGEYFDAIFVGPDKSFSPLSEQSNERLKRKLMMKVLEMQVNVQKHEEKGACTCQVKENVTTFAKYVWATGGHSAAAGHGNLFNETYTAFLGRDARVVFEAIGIEFEDRSYAMGGTASAWEISMCWQQIFGRDVDFFTWDYGMTDGNFPERLLHYGYRGGLSPGNPAFLAVRIGGRSQNQREMALHTLEQSGMSVFVGKDSSFAKRSEGVPNSAGISKAEIEALPYFVRNLRCNEQFENGDPYCREEKYTKWACEYRPRQASWHPGFKSHAMDGHALGLWLIDRLIETLTDLSQHSVTDPMKLWDELRQPEINTAEEITKANLPVEKIFSPENRASPDPSLDLDVFWRGPSLCRTGRLPAQSRFLGYTTNTDKVGNIAMLGLEEYDTGMSIFDATNADAPKNGSMILAYLPGNDRSPCNAISKPDYKDFFFAHQAHGEVSLTFPNEKERKAYEFDQSHYRGLIVVVFVQCEWGKCTKGEVRPETYSEGKFEMTVNGNRVTELTSIGHDSWIPKGEDGFYWKAKSDGTYDLAFLVKEIDGYIKVSSVILY